jgi:predicted ribonuclease YlaK
MKKAKKLPQIVTRADGNTIQIDPPYIAKNDGLSLVDMVARFKGYNIAEPMALIHFTNFRY